MTIQVTPFEILVFGFILGSVCGCVFATVVFLAQIRRALGRFQQNFQRVLTERIPRLTHTIGQLGVSAALVEFTTGIVNDLTRSVNHKIKNRAARRTIGFRSEASKEHHDGR